jgi:alpha-glucosidase
MVMQLSLRGSVCLYQGEELGLPEAELTFEQLVDPFGINFWPEFKGRDGCRTPLPWANISPNGGFSQTAEPWLPVSDTHLPLAVAEQEGERHSVLHAYRDFLHFRRHHPVLIQGDITFHHHDEQCLVFSRHLGQENMLIAINSGDETEILPLPVKQAQQMTLPEGIKEGHIEHSSLVLPGCSVLIATF